jgi:hypothetical protein
MESLYRFLAPPSRCGYLPAQRWQLEYEVVASITPAEYLERMRAGWRRFGDTLFHPQCPGCTACRSLRVLVDRFRPNRSQQRCRKLNEGTVRLQIGKPAVSREKLRLYDRYHAYQSDAKGWPQHPAKDAARRPVRHLLLLRPRRARPLAGHLERAQHPRPRRPPLRPARLPWLLRSRLPVDGVQDTLPAQPAPRRRRPVA